MALEWALLAYAVGAEAIVLMMITMPGLTRLRKGLIVVARGLMQPLMAIVPFCLFLLMDIYWKWEHMPKCHGNECTVTEQARHAKSLVKSQRNAILVISALVLYWLLYCVTRMLVQIEKLNQQVKQLKQRTSD